MRRVTALDERLRALGSPLELALLGALPLLTIAYAAYWAATARVVERDLEIFRTAGAAVLHGRSPYPQVDAAVLAHFDKFVYPPLSALAFVPAAAVPLWLAQVLMFAVGLAAIVISLRMLGVRDWRCYGVSLLYAPCMNSLLLGAVTPLLLLATAAAWRYRADAVSSGVAAACAAVAKLFLWPLAVWLLVTRRIRAVAVFVAASAILVMGAWAVIGFAGLHSYPKLLRVLARVEEGRGYGLVSLLRVTGPAAEVLSAGTAVLVVVGVALLARGADGDRRAFAASVLGALAATPLLWLHYFVLLLAPIAVFRPRLSALWFMPLALWLTPSTQPLGNPWRIGLALAVLLAVGLATLVRSWPVLARARNAAASRRFAS